MWTVDAQAVKFRRSAGDLADRVEILRKRYGPTKILLQKVQERMPGNELVQCSSAVFQCSVPVQCSTSATKQNIAYMTEHNAALNEKPKNQTMDPKQNDEKKSHLQNYKFSLKNIAAKGITTHSHDKS